MHRTCFLVKYFEFLRTPTRVFVRVKSESYKIMGHSCTVLSSTDCCVYTCRHPSSLFTVSAEKKKITRVQALPLGFPVFLETSPSGLTRDKETKRSAKTRLLAGDCRENRPKVFNFLSSIRLIRTLHRSFDVNMIQTTKCSQEDKVWLIVFVF